jgi:hypothetical protein
MIRRTVAAACLALALTGVAVHAAQGASPQGRGTTQPSSAAAPATTPAPSAPGPASVGGEPVNVKIDVTITDQRGAAAPVKRTVSLIAADRNSGRVRSTANLLGFPPPITLGVDATPTVLKDGKIRLALTLSYDWRASGADLTPNSPAGTVTNTTLQDGVSLVLTNGKSVIAAQSADPAGDRQVTVEVMATILR